MSSLYSDPAAVARDPGQASSTERMSLKLPAGAWPLLAVIFSTIIAACSSPIISQATPTPSRPPLISFMSDRGGQFDIYLMEQDGAEVRNLTNSASEDGLASWSSGAGEFAFLTTRESDGFVIYTMDINGEDQKLLINDPPVNASPPVWSPTGEWIAFGSGSEESADVFIVDATGETVRNLTEQDTQQRFNGWSPDGRKLLYTSRIGDTLVIFAVDIDSGDAVQLTDESNNSVSPDWSPDGSKIAFVSDRDEDVEIYVMDADGANVARLTDSSGFDGFPRWSPSGDRIGFVSLRDGDAEIYAMDADGANVVNLTNNPAQEAVQGDFAWSPDGSRILFHTDRDGDVEVYVMDADGANPTNLTQNPGTDLAAIWVP